MQTVTPTDGVRTFLIADIRGYTRFTVEHGDEAALQLASQFATLCRQVVSNRGGDVIELRGDEALAVFTSTRQALWAATELQACCWEQGNADPTLPLQIGIGLDAGEAIPFEGGYRGAALNLAARLCSLAGPGEVLASEAVTHLARRIQGLMYIDRGLVELKGFAEPLQVLAVAAIEGTSHAAKSDMPASHGGPLRPDAPPLPIGGFLGALPAGPLIARDDDLRRALGPIEAVERGEGRLLLLAGEPGVGKTRLAQEVTVRLRNAGFLIVAGSCFETQQTVPYHPFLDVIAGLYAAALPELRSDLSGRWPVLAHLLPDAAHAYQASSNEQEEQQRLFRAVTSLVTELAALQPVAILLDDLHWADLSSLALLPYLARGTRAHRVLLLGTYRDVEVGRQHPLEATLLDLGRQGLTERVAVRRLDGPGTAALIAATLDETEVSEEFSQLVHASTEGNPFFTGEVLRALIERGDVYQENGRWERRTIAELQVPESVRSAIGQRLSHLSDGAQQVLIEASVLGQRFGFDELQSMAERTEEDVERSLDEAASAGLIRDVGKDTYAFEHALTRGALYAELAPRRRRRLHRAAAESLESLPERKREGRIAELALHFLHADDERALPYALLAGDAAAAVFAHAEAEAQYRTALDLSDELGDAEREAEALEKLANVTAAAARFMEAAGFAERSARAYQTLHDAEGERRATSRLAWALSDVDRVDEGLARVRAVMADTDQTAVTPGIVDLASAEAALHFTAFRFQDYLASQERALELARRLGDEHRLTVVSERSAHSLHCAGRLEEAKSGYEQAVGPLEQRGPSRELSILLHNMGDASWRLGHVGRALLWQERGLEIAEQVGDPSLVGFSLAWLGHYETILGHWQQARGVCERGMTVFEEIGASWNSVYPLLFLATLDELEGREGADERLRQAMETATSRRDQQALMEVLRPTVRRSILGGRPGEARALVEKVVEAIPPQALAFWRYNLTAELAWVLLEMGDVAEAEQRIRESLAAPTIGENVYDRVMAVRILGQILGRLERYDEAHAAFEESLALARSMAGPFEEAFTLYQYGSVLAQAGNLEEARTRLADALAIFHTLGAVPYARLTKIALEGYGQRHG